MSDICDVCGKEQACELMSSGCAPVTYSACSECRNRRAENIDVAALWVHMHAGGSVYDEFLKSLVVWLNGNYVGPSEILSYYEANKDSIIADLDADYELIDMPIEPEN